MLSADLTAGMDSMVLVEACLLGCFSLSIQPGLTKKDHLITNILGIGDYCYREDEVETRIGKLPFNGLYRQEVSDRLKSFQVAPGASTKVCRLVTDNVEMTGI